MRYPILLLSCLIFFGCSVEKKEVVNLLECVPQNTLAVFQVNDQNMLRSALSNLPFIEPIFELNDDFYKEIKAVLPESFAPNALLCITPEGKAALAASFIYKASPTDSLTQLDNSKESFTYNSIPVQVEEEGTQKIFKARVKDIYLISSSRLVLENSIRNIQDQKKGIQDNRFFKLADVSDPNAPLNLYLHHDVRELMDRFFPKTELFPFLGSTWFSFDFNTKKDPFTLDGVSFINDSIPDKLTFLKGLEPQPLLSPDYVPQSFDSYLALAVSDYKSLETNFKKYSRYKNIALAEINFDALSGVDEIAWLKTKLNKALYFHITNSEAIPPILFSDQTPEDSYRGISISQVTFPKDLLYFLEAFGAAYNPNYVALVEDFLIYTQDKAYLKQLIGSYLDGNTLANNFNFKSLQEDLADRSTFLWVGNTVNLKNQWKENLPEKEAEWDSVKLKEYPLVALQGIAEARFVQSRFTAQRDNPKQQKNSVVSQYSFTLDASLARAPQWIKNHRNKTQDVVVQDINNVLYLFSNTGTLFWKKQLSGPIVGKIEQVDLYKNRRLQMAFRTPDRFMILDRNGKVVPPFDKKINSETPHHLAVFDYDLNRNYRFLLSHGKKVEMYDNRGRRVSGFKLNTLKQPLQNPPKHIRFGNKDYILLQDIAGQVRIVNRQGKDRIQLKGAANTSSNPIFAHRNTFATTNQEGALLQIDTKGNLTESPLGLRPGHQVDMTSKSLVTLSENKLVIKGIPVVLPFGSYTAPKIHYINNVIYVTLTDLDAQKVYAFYSNGTAVGGFPVYGSSESTLSNADNDKAVEMVVQSEDEGLLIYQIN